VVVLYDFIWFYMVILFLAHIFNDMFIFAARCGDAMQARPMSSFGVRLSVCSCVCHVRTFCQNE